jgi:Ni/Fe-hydrogenase subunit HybB-like protein
MLRALLQPWRVLGLICLSAGLYSGVLRFTRGLAGSTHLSDAFPWGLWIGFDVLCGVGLAAGGFTLSAMVYVFRLERYKALARPAVLTAFIGYLLVIGGLMFDLGRPWNIWHPLVMWNPHSVMFEVAWCVTLYTIVLAAEVSAMVFERLRWPRATRIAHLLTFPLTIMAVLLSMLHQSSLGSLFLIMPGRLHPLWYSMLLPVLFFTSAVAAGLAMVIVESNLSARAFGRYIEMEVLRGAARGAAVMAGVFLSIRFLDLIYRGALRSLWPLNRAGVFFLVEVIVGFLVPMILLASPRIRGNARWMYRSAQLLILGFIVYRLDVSITGFEAMSGVTYVPAWTEVAITLMLITIGVTLFNLAGRFLPVFEAAADEQQQREWLWAQEIAWQRHVGAAAVPASPPVAASAAALARPETPMV